MSTDARVPADERATSDDALPSLMRRISSVLVPEQVVAPRVAAHSAFSKRQRIGIIALASAGSIWSPFTANVLCVSAHGSTDVLASRPSQQYPETSTPASRRST